MTSCYTWGLTQHTSVVILLVAHGNKHRDPNLDSVQTVREFGALSCKWISPSNPASQGPEGSMQKRRQRACKDGGNGGPKETVSSIDNRIDTLGGLQRVQNLCTRAAQFQARQDLSTERRK